MYSIYIRNYKDGSKTVEEETLMYELPAEYPDDELLIDPKVKNEMGKAGSFEFSMETSNPWYSSLLQMRTLIRVELGNETIFFGRVLNVDTDFWGKRKVHCEGALAFLLDTLIQSTKEDERQKIPLSEYVKDLIQSHNNLVEEWKCFQLGEVPGTYHSRITAEMRPDEPEEKKFGSGSWTSTMNCLEDLTNRYGGYLRARYKDGKNYIDWLLNWFDPDIQEQEIQVTENLIDLSGSVDVNGLFTAVIPEGSKNGDPIYLDDKPKTVVKIPHRRTNGDGGDEET